jgi:hypothetical protein
LQVLQDVVRRAQAEPTAQIVIDTYRTNREARTLDLQRGRNIRDRLASGTLLPAAVDPNRIVVRPSGVSTDGTQARIWFVPSGAAMPPGAPPADLGPVRPVRRTGRR